MVPAAHRGRRYAEHAPTREIAIAPMARIPVEPLHRVSDREVEERADGGIVLHLVKDGGLALNRDPREIASGQLVNRCQAGAVDFTVLAELTGQLPVDVMDHARLRGSGILVAGNHPVADGGQSVGFR